MSDVGVTSDVLPKSKKPRKSYKEVDENEFEDDEEEDEGVADTNGANGAGGDDDEDDDEELDEDEFVVEKIFSHYIADDVRYRELPSLDQSTGV